ncbi:MAG: hypothetical protein EU542_01440 [Promethearchaeota archaeon]|nr:MAG: hypothetical protein EU542_01440 [Candidatus Lokiarchaeota archaeon]
MSFYKLIIKHNVKRKKLVLIILFILLSIAFIGKSSKALESEIIYLQTDKELYYTDESIQLEVSWMLDYLEQENASFQIRFFDTLDNLIWNSSEYREKGTFEQNWTIKIEYLNLNFTNFSNTIYIKACVFNEGNEEYMTPIVLATKFITINKRNICCELSNFTDKLTLGKNLSLNARFYSEDTNLSLSGKDIIVTIISDHSKIYEHNYTLNSYGLISLNLSSMEDMVLGINYLVFNISNTFIYNRSLFSFEILVEKTHVYVDIIKYREKIGWSENLNIELFFYYLDDVVAPLINQTIKILIYDNSTMNHQIFLNTDSFGILKINLSTSFYEINYNNNKFYMDLIFNGSTFLKDKRVVLNFEILTSKLPTNYPFISLIIIISLIILSLLGLISYIYQYVKKKPKFKKISEISFKF